MSLEIETTKKPFDKKKWRTKKYSKKQKREFIFNEIIPIY